jgi:hypothetical protein
MNRSYSKIRHIQEANLMLERRVLSEQMSWYQGYDKDRQAAENWYKQNNHTVNMVLSIGSSFIPVIGPFISSGIGMMDAKQRWDEGHHAEAGVVAAFSLIPVVGAIADKIPGIKQLGAKGMSALAGKLASKTPLTQVEQGVVAGIGENSALVTQAVDNSVKQMASQGVGKVADTAAKTQLQKIAQHGIHQTAEKTAEHITGDVLSGEGGKYLNPLKTAVKAAVAPVAGLAKAARNVAQRAAS